MSTIHHMKHPYQMLLIPITLWLGFSLAFIGADYTKSFVACAKGVDQVGFAMVSFGLTDALGSYVFGEMHKHLGRKVCICIGAFLNYVTIFMMINWKVDSANNNMFFIIPALWGLADSAWQTQINSIYGVLFKENHNAAFSNFRLWESLGFALSYAYANYFCTSTKLNFLLVFLTIGMIGYLLIELQESRFLSSHSQIIRHFNRIQLLFFLILSIFVILFIIF